MADQFKYVDTFGLYEGDTINVHGCVFRLKERRVHNTEPHHFEHDPKGFVTFRTDLLSYTNTMPRHWADAWIIQGNSRATWCVLVSED